MKAINNHITKNQYLFIIQSSMIGVGVLSLASEVSKEAHQSGWISVLIGGIYPLTCVLIGASIYKNVSYLDYFQMSKKLYGNILTYIFTLLFIVYFLFTEAFILSGFANLMIFSITQFLSPYVIMIVSIIVAFLTSRKGLTNIGRITELMFYVTFFIFLIPLYFINKGNVTNLLPLIDGIDNILKSLKGALFSYSGIEVCFFIIPFITDTKKIKSSGVIGSLITIALYTMTVLIVVSYIGWRFASKLQYPILYLVGSIELSVIANFETIIIFIWGNKIFQTLSIIHCVLSYCVSNLFKVSYKSSCYFLCLPYLVLASFFISEHKRSSIVDIIMPYFIIYTIIWMILTLLISSIKKRGIKNEGN